MITFNLTVEQVNVLLNALNQPLAAGTVTSQFDQPDPEPSSQRG